MLVSELARFDLDPETRGEAILVFEGLFTRARNGDRSAEATTAPIKPAATRPSIGLALGGGAARGFAHIGVMRTLLAHGIVPDVIVGTSIGAVVGGCYAANHLDTLEGWARGLTVRGVLGYLDISLSGSGLIRGDHLAGQLETALTDARIDDLPIRFAAIATEFNTGHEIWLTRGRWWKPCAPPTRCPAFSRRYASADAGWWTARWSIRCRSRRRARSARGW